MIQTLPLEWFQSHPYVQVWRQQDSNSYFPTLECLNSTLNIDINTPITLSRVDNIVNQYLTLLVRKVRNSYARGCFPKCDKEIAERFQLNRTELQIITSKIRKQ